VKTIAQRTALFLGPFAAVLGLIRWATQGTSTIYTDPARAFYVADQDLGWAQTEESWFLLGLDAVGLLVMVAVGTWLAVWLFKRANASTTSPWWKKPVQVGMVLGLGASAVAPALAIAAMASGLPPEGARMFLPEVTASTAEPAKAAPAKLFQAPKGTYTVFDHPSNTLTAKIKAGGEEFEARFGPLSGTTSFDPSSPAKGTFKTRISVPTKSIDTGVPLRNDHSATDLKADKHPEIVMSLDGLESITATAGGKASFKATGTVSVMGITLKLPVTGEIGQLDEGARKRLSVKASNAFLVTGSVSVTIADTPLDQQSFDKPTIPITARFILVHDGQQI